MASADLVGLAAGALILIAGTSFYVRLRIGRRRKKVSDRIEKMIAVKDAPGARNEDDDLFHVLEGARNAGGLDGFLRRTVIDALHPIGGMKSLRLVVLMGLLAGSIGALIGQRILGLPPLINAGIGLIFGIAAPIYFVQGEATKRRERFMDAFPDAIDLIVRAIRAGIPTSESIAAAGRELPEPLGGEFRRVAQEIAIGLSPDRALAESAARVRIADFNFFVVTLVLQRETGGNLAETLETLSTLLRRRKEMRLKVRALTAEGRFTSKVISGLPFVVMGALFVLNKPYVKLLFTDPTAQLFLAGAVGLIVVGSAMLDRMIKLDV
jgi:Flp pilus assembly protein TadB